MRSPEHDGEARGQGIAGDGPAMWQMIGPPFIVARKFVDIEDGQSVIIPRVIEFGDLANHARGRQQRRKEMSIDGQCAKSQPMCDFFAEFVTAIQLPYCIDEGTAAGNQNNATAGEVLIEPAAKTWTQIRQIVEAAADLDDG